MEIVIFIFVLLILLALIYSHNKASGKEILLFFYGVSIVFLFAMGIKYANERPFGILNFIIIPIIILSITGIPSLIYKNLTDETREKANWWLFRWFIITLTISGFYYVYFKPF